MYFRLLLVLGGLLLPAFLRAQTLPLTLAENSPADTGGTTARPAAPVLYHAADEPPTFPGGPEAFGRFLRKELRYPEEALRRGLSGRVFVRFTITDEGRIRDAEVVKGLGGGLDEEALRLVRIMPWWMPGRVAGQPVWVSYTLPIIFRGLD